MIEMILSIVAFPATFVLWIALSTGLEVARRMPAFQGE